MLQPKSIVVLILASCSSRLDYSLCFVLSPKQAIPKYSFLQNQEKERVSSRIPKAKFQATFDPSINSRSSYQGRATAALANRHIFLQLANIGRQSIEHIYDVFTKFIFFFNASVVRNFKLTDVRSKSVMDEEHPSSREKLKKPWWRQSVPFVQEIQTKFFIFFTTLLMQKSYASKREEEKTTIVPDIVPTTTIQKKKRIRNINTPAIFSKLETNSDKLSARIIEQSIRSLISNVAMHTQNLQVETTDCKLYDILNGKMNQATITFDRLAFRNLKVSAGGTLIARNVILAPLSFSPMSRFVPRYSKPFELDAQGCTLTQDDVMNSSCMRNGLQRLLNLILKRVLLNVSVQETIMTLSVQQVRILGENKIACSGTGITVLGAPFPFEVHTGIEITDNGHVIRFPNIELVINPGIFEARVPIHKFLPVSVDIGPNAKIEQFHIDGKYERIHIDVKATMIPSMTSMAHYRSIDDDIDAKFFCDVGVWLTRVLRFDNSI